MSIKTKNAFIHHIPRTGGMYIRSLCQTNKIPFTICQAKLNQKSIAKEITRINSVEKHHFVPEYWEGFKDTPRLCIVRDPLTWYWSLWGTRQFSRTGFVRWSNHRPFDLCKSGDFNVFIKKVADKYPNGYASPLFDYYAEQSTSVGKFESLRDDVTFFLLNTECDNLKWLEARMNIGCAEVRDKFDTLVHDETKVIVRQLEARAYDRYYSKIEHVMGS